MLASYRELKDEHERNAMTVYQGELVAFWFLSKTGKLFLYCSEQDSIQLEAEGVSVMI